MLVDGDAGCIVGSCIGRGERPGSYGDFGNPASLAVDGTGKFLYGVDQEQGAISIYSIGADGALTFVKNTSQSQGAAGPLGPIRTDPTGNYIYTSAGAGLPADIWASPVFPSITQPET
jgi:6-phosphogluconolactonase (cycloisomerase 2 family)